MKICLVTTFFPPHTLGGDGVHVARLAGALSRRGHRVDVVYSRDAHVAAASRAGGPSPLIEPVPAPVRVTALASRWGRLAPLLTHQLGVPVLERGALRSLLGRRSEQRFDVVHFHNVSLIGGAGVFRHGSGVKLFTAHEYWMDCPTHMLFRFDREICDRKTCLRCTVKSGRPPQLWRYTTALARYAAELDMIIAPSACTASIYQTLPYDFRVTLLPHFLPDAYRRRARGRGRRDPSTGPFCLFAGRLEPIKGLRPVVRSFAAGRPGVPLWIAGDGPEQPALRRIAAGSDNVRFLGHLDEDALGRLYRDAVALILPSAGHEVFGQVILEAFAHGTPALVSPFGGMKDIIEATGGGRVCGSLDDLADEVGRLSTDAGARAALGDAGRSGLATHYDEDRYVDRYEAIVAELSDPVSTASRGRRGQANRAPAVPMQR